MRRLPRPGAAALPTTFAVACAAGLLWASVSGSPASPVALPLFTAGFLASAFLVTLVTRGGGVEAYLELGTVYAAAVALYTIHPLLGFLANGRRYGDLNDVRLFLLQPTPGEVGGVAWLYVAHLAGFVGAYTAARGKGGPVVLTTARSSRVTVVVLLGLYVAIEVLFAVLASELGWRFETNLDRYVAYANLPLLLAQVTGHLGALRVVIAVALLAFLFARPGSPRWLVLPWLALVGWSTWQQHQSRTELVLALLGAGICFHLLVRPLRPALLAGGAILGLAGFLFFGASRDAMGALDLSATRRLFVANEFETLFGNAVDLSKRTADGELRHLPVSFFLSDVLAVVPQQLLPVAKQSPADWYMRTFYPGDAARGVGFCFGSVSESVVGGGLSDALARGAVLGLLFGALHRYVSRRKFDRLWWFVFYVWTTVLAYNCFRSSTFYLLARIVFEFLPVVVLAKAGDWLFGIARRELARRPAGAAA